MMKKPRIPQQPIKKVRFSKENPPTLHELKRQLRFLLMGLDKMNKEDAKHMEFGKEMLTLSEKLLGILKNQFPNDPDLILYERMYVDLEKDFQRKTVDPELDSVFEEILDKMGAEIKASGVRTETPENTIIQGTVNKLKKLGIEPKYIKTKGNPDAKTVVVFAQVHVTDDVEPQYSEAVRDSQTQIQQAIEKAVTDSSINLKIVYTEGLGYDKTYTEEIIQKAFKKFGSNIGDVAARAKVGDTLELVGYEDESISKKTLEVMRGKRGSIHLAVRHDAQNALLGSNVADLIEDRNEPISFMTIGSGHEFQWVGSKDMQRLRISDVLAYYGLNVVLVDTSQRYVEIMQKEESNVVAQLVKKTEKRQKTSKQEL